MYLQNPVKTGVRVYAIISAITEYVMPTYIISSNKKYVINWLLWGGMFFIDWGLIDLRFINP